MATKIAFSHTAYPAGGAEVVTAGLAEYLSGKGYRVYMFAGEVHEDLLSESDKKNITFIPAPFGKGPAGRAAATPFVAGEINRLGIDIVYIPLGGAMDLAYLKEHARAKIVFALHSLPLWEVASYFSGNPHKALTSGSVGKILEWFLIRYPRELIFGKHRRAMVNLHKRNYANSDLYTVLCEPYKERLIEILGLDPQDNHVAVAPNFIQPHDYGFGKKNLGGKTSPAKKKRALFMGRLSYHDKRVDRLLDIWARVHRDFPDWELCIVGDGEEKERLVRKARKLRLTNVAFEDFTTDPAEYYRDASILCLTSSFEGWPMSIAEAQQAGVVPIAFDVAAGLNMQLSPSGVNGILVRPFDKKEYARQLARLMSDEGLRARMSRNVIEKSKSYSDTAIFENWEKLVSELLRNS